MALLGEWVQSKTEMAQTMGEIPLERRQLENCPKNGHGSAHYVKFYGAQASFWQS